MMLIPEWTFFTLTTEELERLVDLQATQNEREMIDLEARIEKLENYHGTKCLRIGEVAV